MSDHEFVEEQEKHLLQLVQITFAAPVGRAAFTLRTEQKNFANLTSGIYLPKLVPLSLCMKQSFMQSLYNTYNTFYFVDFVYLESVRPKALPLIFRKTTCHQLT